jgi:hypothetical protein
VIQGEVIVARARCVRLCVTAGALALVLGAAAAAETLVFSNNSAPGDPLDFGQPLPDKELSTSNWFYSKVRADGTVGVTTENPQSGNGSVEFNLRPGSGTPPSDKSALEYRPGGSLGALADLQSATYDWYRATPLNTTGALNTVHPALRIFLELPGTTPTTGQLVFERAYNGGLPVPVGSWTTETIGTSTKVWNFGFSGSPVYTKSLSDWAGELTGAVVKGFSVDAGSGWTSVGGSFLSYTDNIGWQFEGETAAHYNFEVVPLPAPALLLLAGLAALGAVGRRARLAA